MVLRCSWMVWVLEKSNGWSLKLTDNQSQHWRNDRFSTLLLNKGQGTTGLSYSERPAPSCWWRMMLKRGSGVWGMGMQTPGIQLPLCMVLRNLSCHCDSKSCPSRWSVKGLYFFEFVFLQRVNLIDKNLWIYHRLTDTYISVTLALFVYYL